MSPADRRRWGRLYCLLAGACDAGTGAALMVAPAFTVGLMGTGPAPAQAVYLRFVGAFVAAVGLAYLYPFLLPPRRGRWAGVVEVTALVRLVVAAFVGLAVAARALEPAWLTVTVVDAGLAVTQLGLLGRGFFAEEGGDG